MPPRTNTTQRRPRRYVITMVSLAALVGVVCLSVLVFWQLLNTPAKTFPLNKPITIASGMSIAEITDLLASYGAVRNELLLYVAIMSRYEPGDVKASTYIFSEPLTPIELADQLAKGDYDSNLLRLTHREGERVTELAEQVHAVFPRIATSTFISAALPYEGTLFPETYFFPPHYETPEIIATMRTLYDQFVAEQAALYANSPLTVAEVAILASIIEREANDADSMGMVSGILQNRLAIDMPLQADASIEYVLDKPLSELTPEDLEMDSPYNTYLNRGLPPTPIGNPGRTALLAILNPTPSDYLFYITGNDGVFYYAETYAEHKQNIDRHLR